MLETICYSARPSRSPASAQSAVKSTILAACSTRARSSGEIVPRATIPSSVPSVFLITKSGIGAILRVSLFLEKICKTSRIVTASENGLSGSDCQRGTVGASTAFSATWWITWLIAANLG